MQTCNFSMRDTRFFAETCGQFAQMAMRWAGAETGAERMRPAPGPLRVRCPCRGRRQCLRPDHGSIALSLGHPGSPPYQAPNSGPVHGVKYPPGGRGICLFATGKYAFFIRTVL